MTERSATKSSSSISSLRFAVTRHTSLPFLGDLRLVGLSSSFTWGVAHRSAPRFPLVWQTAVQAMRDLVAQSTGSGMSPSAPVGWRTHVLHGAGHQRATCSLNFIRRSGIQRTLLLYLTLPSVQTVLCTLPIQKMISTIYDDCDITDETRETMGH